MLDIPKPKSFKELLHFLQEQPLVRLQTSFGRRKLTFQRFEDGFLIFKEIYAACLKTQNMVEVGLTFDEKGFIVERDNKQLIFSYKNED